MMNEETMRRNPTHVQVILQRITRYHTQIQILSEQITAENQNRQSYLNRLSADYGALPWWKKTCFACVFLGGTYGMLTLVGLPILLLLPLMGFYGLVSFFLIEHKHAYHENTHTLQILHNTVTQLMTLLGESARILNILTTETQQLNQALDNGVNNISIQNDQLTRNNTRFSEANTVLTPLIQRIAEVSNENTQNTEVMMANLDQIYHTFEYDIETLNNTMIPHLNQTITGLDNSNRTVQALQSDCQARLSELETLIQALTPLLTQESNVTTEDNQTMTRQSSLLTFF